MNFMIETVGVDRARVAVMIGCGNAALQTLTAVQAGSVRRPFAGRGEYFNEVFGPSIVEDDRCRTHVSWDAKAVWG